MFEMLGNWSFVITSKKKPSTGLGTLTEVYKIQKRKPVRFCIRRNPAENVPFDQEAWDIWKELIDEDRIILETRKTTFGKWAIKDLVDRVQKFTLTFVQQRRKL
jgi:alanyl-tRNA synthetase